MNRPPVALLGLGIMGSGMARTLLREGFPLSVYNRTEEKARPFADLGARVARTAREAAQGAEVVIGIVADDHASRAVWLGEQGALAGAAEGAVLVESSTLTTGWVRELGEAAAKRGLALLDAPVTGSRDQASDGQLLFLAGGEEEALGRARPVLQAMSRDIVHVGPAGSGARLKLINNFLCAAQGAALAEAIALIERSGLDRETALDVLRAGAPGSPMVRNLSTRMAAEEYEPPHFELRLMVKDLDYAIGEGRHFEVPMECAAAAREIFQRAVEAGYGEVDLAAVVQPLRDEAPGS